MDDDISSSGEIVKINKQPVNFSISTQKSNQKQNTTLKLSK